MSQVSKTLLAAAAAVFAVNPVADKVYVTEDGNAFLPHARQLAEAHARQSKLPAPVEVTRSMIPADLAKGAAVDEVSRSKRDRKADAEAAAKEAEDKAAAEAAAQEAEDKATAEAAAKEVEDKAAAEAVAQEAEDKATAEAAAKEAEDSAAAEAAAQGRKGNGKKNGK